MHRKINNTLYIISMLLDIMNYLDYFLEFKIYFSNYIIDNYHYFSFYVLMYFININVQLSYHFKARWRHLFIHVCKYFFVRLEMKRHWLKIFCCCEFIQKIRINTRDFSIDIYHTDYSKYLSFCRLINIILINLCMSTVSDE